MHPFMSLPITVLRMLPKLVKAHQAVDLCYRLKTKLHGLNIYLIFIMSTLPRYLRKNNSYS